MWVGGSRDTCVDGWMGGIRARVLVWGDAYVCGCKGGCLCGWVDQGLLVWLGLGGGGSGASAWVEGGPGYVYSK